MLVNNMDLFLFHLILLQTSFFHNILIYCLGFTFGRGHSLRRPDAGPPPGLRFGDCRAVPGGHGSLRHGTPGAVPQGRPGHGLRRREGYSAAAGAAEKDRSA